MSERNYLILLDADARKRHRHVVLNGEIVSLTYADDDIDENWEVYREKFLKGRFA